jgi:hypothetical protein
LSVIEFLISKRGCLVVRVKLSKDGENDRGQRRETSDTVIASASHCTVLNVHAMHAINDPVDRNPNQLEDIARSAIERRANRTLTDAEWADTRTRLLEFVDILRRWDRKPASPKTR